MTEIDENGVSYSEGFKELRFVPPSITRVVVDIRALHIYSISKDDNAFASCRSDLQEVVFPEGSALQEIKTGTFYQCTSLSIIDLIHCASLKSIGSLAFSYCSSLHNIILPPNIETIGDDCFSYSALQSIKIPKSITTIGERAFFHCEQLVSVNFEDGITGLTTFNQYLFGYTKLITIRIPQYVTSFGWVPFEGIPDMKNITLEGNNEGFTIIDGMLCLKDRKTLKYCPSGLKSGPLNIPDGIEIIDAESLHNNIATTFIFPDSLKEIIWYGATCARITTLTIPSSVQAIGNDAFFQCTYLTEVKLPESLTTLPASCFYRTNISEIIIPENVTSIGEYCFAYCTNLKKLKLPAGIKTLHGGFVTGCPQIEIFFDDNAGLIAENFMIMKSDRTSIMQYYGWEEDATIVIPSQTQSILTGAFAASLIREVTFLSDNQLTTIKYDAFSSCSHLTTINLPHTIQQIEETAFQYCTKLMKISFGSSITLIGERCFEGCSNLKEVTFVDTRETIQLTIDNSAFKGCRNLSTIIFGEGLISIGKEVFVDCYSLSKIQFPSSLSQINEYMFASSSIKTVTFANSNTNLKSIADNAFYNASNLSTFQFLEPLISIGAFAFANTSLTSIQLPSTVESIGMLAFNQCTKLKTFSLSKPDSSRLSSLGNSIFQGCRELQTINVTNDYFVTLNNALFYSNKTVLYLFPPASQIEFFQIPSPVKIISPHAFYQCLYLRIVMLSDDSKLETISVSAFQGCSKLKFINLPLSVTYFSADCFRDCNSLSCGLIISNNTAAYREKLIEVGMPRKCFLECSLKMTCKQRIHFRFHPLVYFMFLV